MATLKEYYESDFSHCLKVHIKIPFEGNYLDGCVQYDFAGYTGFLSILIHETNKDINFFINLISLLEYGKTQLILSDRITLPLAKTFPGRLAIDSTNGFVASAKFYGDEEYISSVGITLSRRLIIYSESEISSNEIVILKGKARELGHELIFWSNKVKMERSALEKPLAFISHDSRDKDSLARDIAIQLQQKRCPVWYDEFSLNVGDHLRESIEKGLKECKKCVLILSPNFLSNNGWTKTEFDSIFTRQILEEQKLVLPVWYNVSKKDVYEYSPSLVNVLGLNFNQLGIDEVTNRLHRVIVK